MPGCAKPSAWVPLSVWQSPIRRSKAAGPRRAPDSRETGPRRFHARVPGRRLTDPPAPLGGERTIPRRSYIRARQDLGGQRGQVAQVHAGRRGGDEDRIGGDPAVPGELAGSAADGADVGLGQVRGGQRYGDPGASAGQLDLRHWAHLAGVA